MSAVGQCFKESLAVEVQSTNSTSFTTFVTTLVTTVVMPMRTKKTKSTPTLTNVICISNTASPRTTSINQISLFNSLTTPPLPTSSTSLPLTAEHPHTTTSNAVNSSFIIGIVIGSIAFIFVVASFLSWRQRLGSEKPVSQAIESQKSVVRPSLLPKFSFEKEDISDEGHMTGSAFVDKFTRLNKVHSPGVRWVADDEDITNESKSKAYYETRTEAMVVNTFITGLPDELAVAVGQKLSILAEYDDGWIFCSNEKGEQGMVPVECLNTEKEDV